MAREVSLRYTTDASHKGVVCEGFLLAKWRTFIPFPRKRFYFVLTNAVLSCHDEPYGLTVWEEDIGQLQLAVRKRGRDPELALEEDGAVLLRLVAETLEDFTMWFMALRKTCNATFEKFYAIDERIGRGHYAEVFAGHDRTTKDEFAIKILDKKNLANKIKFIEREKDIMRTVSHPNVVRTYDIFETIDTCHIVMELCEGGRLFDSLVKVKRFMEPQARVLMGQVVRGVAYLHNAGIVHRDLKAENILLAKKCVDFANAPRGMVKISDFGLSRRVNVESGGCPETSEDDALLRSCAGTPQYIAPEILRRRSYSTKADIWSLGVLLYVLLSGTYPFMADQVGKVLEKVAEGRLRFPRKYWENINPMATNLIQAMLTMDPDERPTAEQILQHPWFQASPGAGPLSLCTTSGERVDKTLAA